MSAIETRLAKVEAEQAVAGERWMELREEFTGLRGDVVQIRDSTAELVAIEKARKMAGEMVREQREEQTSAIVSAASNPKVLGAIIAAMLAAGGYQMVPPTQPAVAPPAPVHSVAPSPQP